MDTLQKKTQHLLNLLKSKKLSKAELLGKELISAHPNNVILYNILGLVLTYQKKIDEAIECYEKGIKIEPNFAVIYNNLGSIYKSRENYTKPYCGRPNRNSRCRRIARNRRALGQSKDVWYRSWFSRHPLFWICCLVGAASPERRGATEICNLPTHVFKRYVAVFEQPWSLNVPSRNVWFALIGLTLFGTAFAYIVYFQILARAGPSNVMLVTLLIPITALFLGNVFLDEALRTKEIVGALIIGTGLLFIDGRVPKIVKRQISA